MGRRDFSAVYEIVSAIEACGDGLLGDPDGIARILEAVRDAIGPRRDESGPRYGLYEESQHGRMVAEAEQASNEAWNWLMDELEATAAKCRHCPELYT